MVDEHGADGDAEQVVPPTPVEQTPPAPAGIPLAPPLGAPPAQAGQVPPAFPPAPQWGAPPAPTMRPQAPWVPQQSVPTSYRQGHPQQPAAPANPQHAPGYPPQAPAYPQQVPVYPQQQPAAPAAYPPASGAFPQNTTPLPGGYPASVAAPPPTTPSKRTGLVLAIVGAALVVLVVGVAVLIGAMSARNDAPVAVPTSAPATSEPEATPDAGGSGESDDVPKDPGGASGVGARLEAKIEEYKSLRQSGALWDQIPENDFNKTAVVAYLYLLTDMKLATGFGVDAQTESEYGTRMDELEDLLLAEEPLGTDIKITLSDGRVFEYDGDTGAGGYTQE